VRQLKGAYRIFGAFERWRQQGSNASKYIEIDHPYTIIHSVKLLHETIRVRRIALGLSQAEAARRAGIQQRQVSLFERGGDVTLATLTKLAQALDLELLLVPREAAAKVESLLMTERGRAPAVSHPASPPSLLERYQVKDEEEPSSG
jgi:transcriptional regulator with XRE-family HTH domain